MFYERNLFCLRKQITTGSSLAVYVRMCLCLHLSLPPLVYLFPCLCVFCFFIYFASIRAGFHRKHVPILPLIYVCVSFALVPLTGLAVSVGIWECQLRFGGGVNVVTMSLGQYARVSPSAGNTTPHRPYTTARRFTEKCCGIYIIHKYTPTAYSVSGVDASSCELASVFSIFHRLLSRADCVAAFSCYNQLLYNGFKWEVKCTWLAICPSSD